MIIFLIEMMNHDSLPFSKLQKENEKNWIEQRKRKYKYE